MADPARPVLPYPVAHALVASLICAGGNLAALAGAGGGRIRDLRILRIARRVTDQFDWNLLSALPAPVHSDRVLATVSGSAQLFVAACVAALVLLLPLSFLSALFARWCVRFGAGKNETAIALSLLAIPTLAFAGGGAVSPLINAGFIAVTALVVFFLASRPKEKSLHRVASFAALGTLCVVIAGVIAGTTSRRGVEGSRRHAARAGAPNILLISIDSLRADHIHTYGYPRRTSPNIDGLAAEGTVFETVMSPTSWTLPAHMTLMTSLAPEEHGVITNRLRLARGVDTLPQRLKRSGYATAGFVSATYLDGLYGFNRGFDEYDDYSLLRTAGAKSRVAVTSQHVAGRAIQWLHANASPGKRPFFLFLHFFDVHYDYNPPPPFAQMFDAGYRGAAIGAVESIHAGMPTRDLRHDVALYDGEIAWVDANIGRILETLRTMGVDQNTIVVVTADHGEEFLEHGQAAHDKTLYDEVLRVPLVIRYPGHVAAGRRLQGQVRLMDVAPTLLALAGLAVDKPRERTKARSLACLTTSPLQPLQTLVLPAFGDLRGEVASVRTGDAKLIRNLRTRQEEFYNLGTDPGEKTNLAAGGERGRDQLRVILDHWRSSTTTLKDDEANLDEEEKDSLRSLGYLQ
jgi:arylsulfatase A-like enzyme